MDFMEIRFDRDVPIDRDEAEEELNEALAGIGEVSGAGSGAFGAHLDVDIDPAVNPDEVVARVLGALEGLGLAGLARVRPGDGTEWITVGASAAILRAVVELRAALLLNGEWRVQNALPPGNPCTALEIPVGVGQFLTVMDGATCGDVTVFGAVTAEAMQFHADPVPGAPVTLGREDWFCPGVISDEPFFVNRSTGAVWYFPDTGVAWWMSATFEKATEDFATFFLEWMAGPQYARISATGPDDPWADVLRHVGRLW